MNKKVESQEGFEVHLGLSGIRFSPGVYLGQRGAEMAYRCVKELVDNAYDEATNGRNSTIEVILDYDKDVYCVADKAGGIPTDIRTLTDGTKESVLTSAFMRVHAGGKFNTKAYAKGSSGTHGTGVAAVNAVCDQTRVWSNYKPLMFQSFSCGETVSGPSPIKVKSVDADVKEYLQELPKKYGTIVAIHLDQTVVSEDVRRGHALPKGFRKAEPVAEHVKEWLYNMAQINPGIVVRLKIIRDNKVQEHDLTNKKDLASVAKTICTARNLSPMGKPLVIDTDSLKASLVWSDAPDTNNFLSLVNCSPTIDHGWHVVGFNNALMAAIRPFLPKGKQTFTQSDLLLGLTGVLDWRMHGASFTSQVKDKLASRVDKEVYDSVLPTLTAYFDKNKTVAKNIVKRAQVMNKGRAELASVVKSLAEVKKKTRNSVLPANFAVASKCKVQEREIYIVEGNSAKGPCVASRDTYFQEVFAARGKGINALSNPIAKVLANNEVQDIIRCFGGDLTTFDPQDECPKISSENLRIGKVICLADKDEDGNQISVLMLTLIYRLFPDLFREGRVYVVDSYLYMALDKNGKLYGGNTFVECRIAAPASVKDKDIVRVKGWGEVDSRYMRPMAFDPAQRKLIQINPFASEAQRRLFHEIVAEGAEHRRKLLGLEE